MAACEWWDIPCLVREALFDLIVGFLLWIADGIIEAGRRVGDALRGAVMAPFRALQAFLTYLSEALQSLGLAAPVAGALVFVFVALLAVVTILAMRFAAERIWELL